MTDERSNEQIIEGALFDHDFTISPEAAVQVHAALAAAGRLVTPEHDAQVLRDTADEVDSITARPVGLNSTEQMYFRSWHAEWLRKRADALGKGQES